MTRNVASAARKTPPAVAPAAPERATAPKLAPKLATEEAAPVASHVHDLQDLLVRRLEAAPRAGWSPRATAGFVILVCGGFWVGVFLAVKMLLA